MKITRDVILDLLPLYLADEVSEDTRELVQLYLEEDPKMAQLVEVAQVEQLPDIPAVPITQESEMKTYQKTRLFMIQHHVFLVLAILFTIIFIAFAFGSFVEPYMPKAIPILFFFVAAFFWVGFGNIMYQINKL